MQKKPLLIFAVLLLSKLFFGQNFVQAQTFSEPKRLLLEGDKVNEDFESPTLIKELFYPIGWSKDGKFAYLVEPPDEACGCYFANLIIQDLRTDKILWENKYQGQESANEDLKSHWNKNQKLFSQKLAEYGIKAHKNFALRKSPLKVANDTVNIDFSSDVELTEDVYSSKGTVSVKLVSKQKGSKTVYQKTYNGTGYDGIMNIKADGVLLSPFESRAAIILVETRRGWEGPPNVTRIRVVGAAFEKGFVQN